MKTPPETPRFPTAPNQESPLPTSHRGLFGRRKDGYENPSLERYSDLRFDEQPTRRRRWVWILFGVLAIIPLVILGFMGAIYYTARQDEARPVDAILVLGAAQYNGRPSITMEARIQHALELYNQGLAPVIIVCGGNQPGDTYTEAGTMEAWLMNRGVPQRAIIVEDQSNSTWQSFENARSITRGRDIESILIVSDGFHLFRSERMADAVGFEAYGSPAPNRWIPTWSLREFEFVVRETGATIWQIPDWLF